MSRKIQKYIDRQPQQPEGFRYRTPILVSDSKGFTLRNFCKDRHFPIESWCQSGATTSQLVDIIEERLPKAIKRHHSIIIYLWAGTCDLTYKEGRYIKLRHKSFKSVNNILEQYRRAIKIIESYTNADIKFVDCPILSISWWNKFKGHRDPDSFKNSDSLVTKQVKYLNQKIWSLNHKLNKDSVKISKYFFRGRKRQGGNTRKSVTLSINNKDGVHPGKLLSLAITKHLLL